MSTADTKQRLEEIEKQKPHLVLLDIKMPDMDGIEVLKYIREKDKAVKVIMVTGKGPDDENALDTCRQFGVLDYIHKPLEIDSLEKKVLNELDEGAKNKSFK